MILTLPGTGGAIDANGEQAELLLMAGWVKEKAKKATGGKQGAKKADKED